MAARSSLLPDRDDPVPGARNGALHEQEVPVGVDLDDSEAEFRVLRRAVMARHLLALDDARRIGTRADRARLAVPRVAVRRWAAVESMAVHHALEPATLGG